MQENVVADDDIAGGKAGTEEVLMPMRRAEKKKGPI